MITLRHSLVVFVLVVAAASVWGVVAEIVMAVRPSPIEVVLARQGGSEAAVDRAFATVRGRVVDPSGQGVAGAKVLGDDCRGRGLVIETDANGRFEGQVQSVARMATSWPGRPADERRAASESLESSEMWISASAEGFCGSSIEEVTIVRDERADDVSIRLWRGGFVRGRVVDRSGAPVAAEVAARSDEVHDVPVEYAGHVKTRHDDPRSRSNALPGEEFVLGPLMPGMFVVSATAAGQGGVEQVVAVAEGETTEAVLTVAMTPHLSGRVVDSEGRGLEGVLLVCRPEPRATDVQGAASGGSEASGASGGSGSSMTPGDPKSTPTRNRRTRKGASREARPQRASTIVTARSGADGAFWFAGLSTQERYAVGVAAAASTLHDLQATQEGLVLVSLRPQTVRGRLVDARSKTPVSGAVVRAIPAAVASMTTFHVDLGLRLDGADAVRSGADGTFELGGLMPGAFELQALAQGFEVARKPLELTAREPQERDAATEIELVRAPTLRGVVRDQDGPCEGVAIEVHAVSVASEKPGFAWSGVLQTTTDELGEFAITQAPAGAELRIAARDEDQGVASANATLRSGETTSLDLLLVEPPHLTVRLLREDGDGLPGFPVSIRSLDDPGVEAQGVTDPRGVFTATDLLPGRWIVAAVGAREDLSRPEVAARRREVTLTEGEVELTFPAPDLTFVTGTVSVEGDAPELMRISLGPMEGTPDHFEPVLFEVVDGTFGGLAPPGRYHVGFKTAGRRAEAEAPLEVPDRAVLRTRLLADFDAGK